MCQEVNGRVVCSYLNILTLTIWGVGKEAWGHGIQHILETRFRIRTREVHRKSLSLRYY